MPLCHTGLSPWQSQANSAFRPLPAGSVFEPAREKDLWKHSEGDQCQASILYQPDARAVEFEIL